MVVQLTSKWRSSLWLRALHAIQKLYLLQTKFRFKKWSQPHPKFRKNGLKVTSVMEYYSILKQGEPDLIFHLECLVYINICTHT